jgi:transposase-like protein
MDDKIIGLYAAGLSTRDIRANLEEVYDLKVSADLISRVTDAVLAEESDWQNRALEPMYPIVFLDALSVKIRDAETKGPLCRRLPGSLRNKSKQKLDRSWGK